MKLKTYLVLVDGDNFLGYVRGTSLAYAEGVAELRFGGNPVGLKLIEVDGQQLVLDMIRDYCNTTQKITDRTRMVQEELRPILFALTKKKIIQYDDGVWSIKD